jgi:Spy/CpxP family protein refolding chaperone
MRRNIKYIVVAVSGVVLAATIAGCGHRHYSDESRGEWLVERVSDELDLTEPQKTKLEAVRQEILAARKATRADREATREEVLSLLNEPQLDQQKVLSLIQEKTTAVNQYAPQVVAKLGSFYDSLTDEQRKALREHVAEMSERHHRHHW